MLLTTTRNLVDGATQIYRSGGILILVYRMIGYLWKECAWFWIRVQTRGELIERTVCGNRMYLSPHDTGILKELAVYKIHEPLATQLLRQEIKAGMRVVDIGANIGYYALQEAHLVGETGEVIAIEPVPDNVGLLRMNVEANGYKNVRIYPVAIGAEDGTTKLYLSHESNLCSLGIREDVHYACIDVSLRTLDSLLESKGKIDYIRMDIEGYETEAIKGMLVVLEKHRPGMLVEIHQFVVGGEPISHFLKELKVLGYETKYVIGRVFDNAITKRKKHVEKLPLDELIRDKRVTQGRDALTVFLEAI